MRIRSIKPEFWTSESVGRLSRDARLLFIGLWSFAEDSGRGRGAFPAISGSILPYDSDALENLPKWFSELEREGMVRRYKGEDGNTYFDIPNWLKHQKIEKPSKPRLPAFVEGSPNTPRILPEISGEEPGTGNREPGASNREPFCAFALSPDGEKQQPKNGKRFTPPTEDEAKAHAQNLGLPVWEADKFLGYYQSNGWKVGRNPMKDWKAAMRNWAANWTANGKPAAKPQAPMSGAEYRRSLMEVDESTMTDQDRANVALAKKLAA